MKRASFFGRYISTSNRSLTRKVGFGPLSCLAVVLATPPLAYLAAALGPLACLAAALGPLAWLT